MPSLSARLQDMITIAGQCDTTAEAVELAEVLDRLVREFRVGAETGEDRVRLVRLCAEAGVAVRDALSRTGPADFDEPEPQPQPARVSEEEPVISIEGPFGLSPQRVRLQSREAAYHRRPR
ncbi:hypothetical protein [Nocardia wallacei]|uniref:Uncharacterized protein n=1 Tax=Nocardia wallacei TaxID=480035 RepID=A0A7G1KM32_9NOCA|nr:hypothetical protein [Nocardia wallacei]BCK55646.1 hypothetical protein NWFMUON74_34180 [Nocardia wallacei]